MTLRSTDADVPPFISAANFCRTSPSRVVLHIECLCHHPAAARFHFLGLTRNLRECVKAAKFSTLKSLKRLSWKNPT